MPRKRKPIPEPVGIVLDEVRREFDWPIRCTSCGGVEDLDCYDVGGLDDGDLACNACGHIGPMQDLSDYTIPSDATQQPGAGTPATN